MSRIGNKPIPVPSGVQVTVGDQTAKVKGPKGELTWQFPDVITVRVDGSVIHVARSGDTARERAMHGMVRAMIANMVVGVSQGYEKKLAIYGTGYGCQVKAGKLLLNCGFMGRGVDGQGKPKEAQFVIDIPKGVTVTIEAPAARGDSDPARMTITGADKETVGGFAADVRKIRPPEPYKGKGIRYADEYVKRKQGKAFASGGG